MKEEKSREGRTFTRMLESTVDDGAEQLRLEDEVSEVGRVDAYVVTPKRITRKVRWSERSSEPTMARG